MDNFRSMKRFLLVIFSFLFVLSSFAQLNGDGYYRVKNVASGRYITVRDNRGSVNIGTSSADMGAVELYKGFDNVVSDPSSVLYIHNAGDGNYKFYAQGTDTYEIIGYYLKLKKNSDGSYKAYQGNSMMVMYLGDSETTSVVDGKLSTNAKGQYRDWYILPISSSSSDNYFGLTPEVKTTDAYYASFYASFPFSVVSKQMKVYYVDQVSDGVAVYKEYVGDIVPGASSLFVKCVSALPSDNKLDIVANSVSAISNNKLSGVYFCNHNSQHLNRLAYNPETMRVLGTTADGKLAYVKADYDYLPANRSYLTVPAGSPDVIKLVSEEEYQKENQQYTITFKIGDEIISSQKLKKGAAIVAPEAPKKEGYTFNGWGDVPATMPAQDLTFTGTYTINNYVLTFEAGGEIVAKLTLPYGTPIEVPDAPEKEGYTFDRWDDIPATMPAYDLTCKGYYHVNSYTIQYKVDGQDYRKETLEYGAFLILIDEPEKEGRKFSGWSDAPKSMPAYDLVVEGTFMYYVYYYANDVLVHTAEVYFGETIPDYVYKPAKESDTFLGWLGDAYVTMPAHDITYVANIELGVDVMTADVLVEVYTMTGTKILSGVSLGELKSVLKRGIYIVNGKKMIIE